MPRTYVNNASNRAAGRVGMAHGTAVILSGSSGSRSSASFGGFGTSSSTTSSPSSNTTPKTYVDNAYNRSHERVGMDHGTAVISKNSSSSISSGSDTYLGSSPASSSTAHTYVDNAYNRKYDRVGKELGTEVISKQKSSTVLDGATSSTKASDVPPVRVYVDNELNRGLGRVGKPFGTAVFSKGSKRSDGTKERIYADNDKNRATNRVGKPKGSEPQQRKNRSKTTTDIEHLLDHMDDTYELPEYSPDVIEFVVCYHNRQQEETDWRNETETRDEQHDQSAPKTDSAICIEYSGKTINFSEIELKRKIGHGGFGDVHFAMWKGSVVAVKKLRVEQVSKRRLKEFVDEAMTFGKLDHPNIVKFIGACVECPNLAIVMEYMQMSLFEGIFVRNDAEFTEAQRLDIIVQTSAGMIYLKQNQIAHCDFKSQNVLIETTVDANWIAKITDFGLSMMKANTETSVSGVGDRAQNIGTPRFSAPEVLRGERLSVEKMIKADVYSLGLVMFEVIYEDEPFYDLNLAQLTKQVGEIGLKPEIPSDRKVNKAVSDIMTGCLSFDADKRPDVTDVFELLKNQASIFDN